MKTVKHKFTYDQVNAEMKRMGYGVDAAGEVMPAFRAALSRLKLRDQREAVAKFSKNQPDMEI